MMNYDLVQKNGNGDVAVVMVHGSGCNRNFLKSLAELCNYDTILVDLPGHGETDGEQTLENYVTNVTEFLKECPELQGKKVVLSGHSLGTAVILEVASKNIDSVIGVVPISSIAKAGDAPDCFNADGSLNLEALAGLVGNLDNPDIISALQSMESPENAMADLIIGVNMDIRPDLKNVKVPVLMLVGDEDKLTLPEFSYEIQKHLTSTKSEVKEIKGFKHGLPIAGKEIVAQEINNFIKSL